MVWHCYLASDFDLKAILTLVDQDTVTRPASPIAAAMADVENPAKCLLSSSVKPDDEEYWTIGDLVEAGPDGRVGVERLLHDLQDSCCVKKRKVPESVSEAVVLAVELINDVVASTSSCAGSSIEPRINELTQELSITRVKVVSLTAKLGKL